MLISATGELKQLWTFRWKSAHKSWCERRNWLAASVARKIAGTRQPPTYKPSTTTYLAMYWSRPELLPTSVHSRRPSARNVPPPGCDYAR